MKLIFSSIIFSSFAFGQLLTSYVNTGGSAYTDASGVRWIADSSYSGGYSVSTASSIASTNGQASTYQTARQGYKFGYAFSVPNGTYSLTLKFADWQATAAGQRVFNVTVNSASALSNFDIYSQAGGQSIALDKTVSTNVCDGTLSIALASKGPETGTLIPGLEALLNGMVIKQTGSTPACSSPSVISSCGTFGPGNYTLSADLNSCSAPAVLFSGTGDASLDCNGHYIAGITSADKVNVSIRNCKFNKAMVFVNGPGVSVTDSTFSRADPDSVAIAVLNSTQVSIAGNVFNSTSASPLVTNNYIFVAHASNVTILSNRLGVDCRLVKGPLLQFSSVSSAMVRDNIIGADMTVNSDAYTDDNLVQIESSDNITLQSNLIRGTRLTGVEFVGPNDSISLLNNSFIDTGVKAIGGQWGISLTNSVIDGNTMATTAPTQISGDALPYASRAMINFRKKYKWNWENQNATFAKNRISNNKILSFAAADSGNQNMIDFTTVSLGNPDAGAPAAYDNGPYHTSVFDNWFYGNDFGRAGAPGIDTGASTVLLFNAFSFKETGHGSLGGNKMPNALPTYTQPFTGTAVSLSTPDSLSLYQGQPGTIRFAADGAVSAQYEVTMTGLPPGMASSRIYCQPNTYCPWNGSTQPGITLYGTPSTPGTYTVTVTAYDSSPRYAYILSLGIGESLGLWKQQSFTVTVLGASPSCDGSATSGSNWVQCLFIGANNFDQSTIPSGAISLQSNPFPYYISGGRLVNGKFVVDPSSTSFAGNFSFSGGYMVFPVSVCGNAQLIIDGTPLSVKSSTNGDAFTWIYNMSSGTHNVRLNWWTNPTDCNTNAYGVDLGSWYAY